MTTMNSKLIQELLDISGDVPLEEREMADALSVTFLPPHEDSLRIRSFAAKLENTFRKIGVTVIPFEEALLPENGRRVRPGVVLVAQGTGNDGELGIDYVSSLYNNPVIGIREGPPPISENADLQQTLDSIVGVLAWDLTHLPVFVEEDRWTMCTMNGAVVGFGEWSDPEHDVLHSMVPKLAAQVVPPDPEQIVYHERVLDAVGQGYGDYIEDFMSSARIWRENGLMLAHTSIEGLEYRNRYYKRIVSMYLDHRTGMSYGFLVKQLPVSVTPALKRVEAPHMLKDTDWESRAVIQMDNKLYTRVRLAGDEWIVELPDIWFLSTRSGCNKTNLDPERDILRLGLRNGEITIETPVKAGAKQCRPSYDTYVILAHGIGNAIVASILLAFDPNAPFATALCENGLSISHWHGYPENLDTLPGYVFHGHDNPPVSCSTPQSAVYAAAGKIRAVEKNWHSKEDYRGDVHVEPHHGTNITGSMSLTESARWVDEMLEANKRGG